MDVKNLLSMSAAKTGSVLSEKQIRILTTLIYWPSDICYPGLDVLRLLIRNPNTSKHFIDNGEEVIKHLINVISTEQASANQDITTGVVFRIFSNLFSHERGVNLMLEQSDLIMQCTKDHCKNSNKNVQIAVCTVLINFAVVLRNGKDYEAKVSWLNTLKLVFTNLVDNEAKFRGLVALGTLIWGDQDSISYAKILELPSLVQPVSSVTSPEKMKRQDLLNEIVVSGVALKDMVVGKCATQLMEAFR